MKIVITGKIGVGKTDLINASREELTGWRILHVDDFIKNVFYSQGHPVYEKIVNFFDATLICEDNKISNEKLCQLILLSNEKYDALQNLIKEDVKNYLKTLKGNWIIEMGSFLNNQDFFGDIFDEVILITRTDVLLTEKFPFLESEPLIEFKKLKKPYTEIVIKQIGEGKKIFLKTIKEKYIKNL